MDTALFYQHLAGLTKEYERLVQEKADLTKLFSDASSAVLLQADDGVLDREGAASIVSHKDDVDLPFENQKPMSGRQALPLEVKPHSSLGHSSPGKSGDDLDEPNQAQFLNMAYEIEVTVWKATGLREADIVPGMSSDPYCICAVQGKGKSKFTTPTVSNDLCPVWNVCARITDFHYGDALSFTVWDKDFGKTDDALGEVSLPSEKIIPHGFDEWLVLAGAGTKGVVSSTADISSIKVAVRVLRKFPQEMTQYVEPVVQSARNVSKETSSHSRSWDKTARNGDDEGEALKGAEVAEDSQQLAAPPMTRFQRCQAFLTSEKFELFLAGLLCVNILSMAMELQYDGWEIGYLLDYGFYSSSIQDRFSWGNDALKIIDMTFSVIFTIDVTLRIAVLQGLFWRGGITNYIDLLVVVLSWTVYILAENFPVKPMILRLIRFGKLVRALKVVRLSQSLESLAFLMSCLRASGTVLVWTMSLLALIQCIAALFVSNMLHFFLTDPDWDQEVRKAVFRYYGTFSGAFLTMFEILFANWAPACRVLTDNVTEWWTLFFLLYRCLVGFAVLNVVNAVFVQSTLKVAHADEELQFEAKQKAQRNLMTKLQNMFLALDTSGDGLLSWEEFNEAISSPKMAFWMSQLELESSDLKSLFQLLDGGDGLISVNEFMEGATRLRGPAKSIDVARLLMLCTKTEKTLKGIVRVVRPLLDDGSSASPGSALIRRGTLDTLGSGRQRTE